VNEIVFPEHLIWDFVEDIPVLDIYIGGKPVFVRRLIEIVVETMELCIGEVSCDVEKPGAGAGGDVGDEGVWR
jgi:hypothetical protein